MDSDHPGYNGGITISVREHIVIIELYDDISSIRFAKVELSPQQFCQTLSGLYNTPCDIITKGLDKVGKKMVMDKMEFEMPTKVDGRGIGYYEGKEIACALAEKYCPEGWKPDLYFGSKNSFFSKDGKEYARTTIRKWE